MHDKVLREFREAIRTLRYVVTIHAEEELTADGYSVFDLEKGVLDGRILERQRDTETAEYKYVIRGPTFSERDIELVAKRGATGMMIIITVYQPEG